MSDKKYCYKVTKLDRIMAEMLGWSPLKTATIRGLHDTYASSEDFKKKFGLLEPIKEEEWEVGNAANIANKLQHFDSTFKTYLSDKARVMLKEGSGHEWARTLASLKNNFTVKERQTCVETISYAITKALDKLQREHPEFTRKELFGGVRLKTGERIGGMNVLFNDVFDMMLSTADYAEQLKKSYPYYVEQLDERIALCQKMISNFQAIVAYSKRNLLLMEDLALGNVKETVEDIDLENLDTFGTTDDIDSETITKEAWQEIRDQIPAFQSLGKITRRLFARIPTGNTNTLGYPEHMNPIRAHQLVATMLKGAVDKNDFYDKLNREAANGSAWAKNLVEKLTADPNLKTIFYADMKSNFLKYSKQSIIDNGKVAEVKTPILNDNKRNVEERFNYAVETDQFFSDKDRNVDYIALKEFQNLLKRYFVSKNKSSSSRKIYGGPSELGFFGHDENSVKENGKVSKDKQAKILTKTLSFIYPEDTAAIMANRVLSNKDLRNKVLKHLQNIASYGFGDLEKGLGLALRDRTVFENLPSTKDASKYTDAEKAALSKVNALDNFYKNFENLLKLKDANSENEYGSFHEHLKKLYMDLAEYNDAGNFSDRVSFLGNMYNSIVKSGFMGNLIEKFRSAGNRNDAKASIQKFLDEIYGKSSQFVYTITNPFDPDDTQRKYSNRILQDLYEFDEDDKDALIYNIDYDRFLGDDKKKFEEFGSKDHTICLLNRFWFCGTFSNKTSFANYPTFILGDSGAQKFMKAKKYSKSEIIDGIYDLYMSERRRMNLLKAVNADMKEKGYGDGVEYMNEKEGVFTVLPFFNKVENALNLTEKEAKAAIENHLSEGLKKFKNHLDELGLLEKVEVKGKQVYKYFDKEMQRERFHKENFVEPKHAVDSDERYEDILDNILGEYFYNHKFNMMCQMQIMDVDPGFFKNVKEIQKRNKQIHASGTELDIDAEYDGKKVSDGTLRAIYFDDLSYNMQDIDNKFLDVIKGVYGENSPIYKLYTEKNKNTLTDGQSYRTPESYRKVMIMSGNWNAEMERNFNELQSIRTAIRNRKDGQPNALDAARLSKLSVMFQPIKPFYYDFEFYGINNNTDGMLIPVQRKNSEVMVIPEVLPTESPLRQIISYMSEKDIDVLDSTKVVKVGCYGQMDIKNKSAEQIAEALSKVKVHELPYSGYRIQNNVPQHIDATNLFGTQLRKLIMTGLNSTKVYDYFKGKSFKVSKNKSTNVEAAGNDVLDLYNSLIMANTLSTFNAFKETILNAEALSDRLMQNVLSNEREIMDNMFAYSLTGDDKFIVPLFEGALEHDAAASLLATFKKKVNKQKIRGGSAVQVSAFGIKGKQESENLKYVTEPGKNNILYAEVEMPWAHTINVDGVDVELDFSKYCNPDGTLKLSNIEISENDPEWKLNQSYVKEIDGVNKVFKPLIEVDYPDILTTIAYRIPTERAYSMLHTRTVKFSPKVLGGTIKVPVQGTTIAGFDFDIDKLYFMKKEFEYIGQNRGNEEVWNDIYNDYPAYKSALETAKQAAMKHGEKDKDLYTYWKWAGLPGTAEQFYQKYRNGKLKKYAMFNEYDATKTPLENSTAMRNNLLMDIIKERLMDEETIRQRTTPGGFEDSRYDARIMRELLFADFDPSVTNYLAEAVDRVEQGEKDPEPEYDYSDPMTIIIYNQMNQIAGKLIGMAANQNAHHAFCGLMKSYKVKKGKGIKFAGHNEERDFLHKDNPSKRDAVEKCVAEFLAASVDAVKDPVLNFLNLNNITAGTGITLARLGYNTREIGLLLNQPIIKAVCKRMQDTGERFDSAVKNVSDTFFANSTDFTLNKEEFNNQDILANYCSAENLAKCIVKGRNGSANKEVQYAALQIFRNARAIADNNSKFIKCTRFTAANSVDSTFGGMLAQQESVASFLELFKEENADNLLIEMEVNDTIKQPINNDEKLLEMSDEDYLDTMVGNPFAYEQCMYDMNRKSLKILAKYFPYETKAYKAVRDKFKTFLRYGSLTKERINSLHQDFIVYLLSSMDSSSFNGDSPSGRKYADGTPVSNYAWYTNDACIMELAKKCAEHPILNKIIAESYMAYETDENMVTQKVKKHRLVIENVGALTAVEKDEINSAWEDLIKDPETQQFAVDLYFYNYFNSGFRFTGTSFGHLTPTAVKLGIKIDGETSYIDYLNELLDDNTSPANIVLQNSRRLEDFFRMYVLNHADDCNEFIYSIYKKSLEYEEIQKLPKDSKKGFTISEDALKNKAVLKSFFLGNDNLFAPFIRIDNVLYCAQANLNDSGTGFNYSSNKTMRYVPVDMNENHSYTAGKVEHKVIEKPVATAPAVPAEESQDDPKSKVGTKGNPVAGSSNISGPVTAVDPWKAFQIEVNGIFDTLIQLSPKAKELNQEDLDMINSLKNAVLDPEDRLNYLNYFNTVKEYLDAFEYKNCFAIDADGNPTKLCN